MNTKNENFTPRERVDAEFLEKLLRENDSEEMLPASAAPQMRTCDSCASRRTAPRRTPAPRNNNAPCSAPSLAMVYSPKQEFTDLFEPEEGLWRGTIFMQLDKPLNAGCCREGRWKA